jgi:hypothetical protein
MGYIIVTVDADLIENIFKAQERIELWEQTFGALHPDQDIILPLPTCRRSAEV